MDSRVLIRIAPPLVLTLSLVCAEAFGLSAPIRWGAMVAMTLAWLGFAWTMLRPMTRDGQPLLNGHAYVAPGGRHLRVVRSGARWFTALGDDAPVRGHKPSVDVLFQSVADHAGANACAALLTGMGDDGARGLLALRKAGAATFAQDEATSVVWGMPGAAVALNATDNVIPLSQVAYRLLEPLAQS